MKTCSQKKPIQTTILVSEIDSEIAKINATIEAAQAKLSELEDRKRLEMLRSPGSKIYHDDLALIARYYPSIQTPQGVFAVDAKGVVHVGCSLGAIPDDEEVEELLGMLAFVQRVKTGTVNAYRLKHALRSIGASYVTHGACIVACAKAKIPMHVRWGTNTVQLGISRHWLATNRDERKEY